MLIARFVAVALIQTAVLLSMVYERATILRTGTAVMLKTEPIDPRSLFRGDYVILNYDISRLSTEELEGDNEFERLQPIYVALEERGQFWSATGIYNAWPTIIGDQIIIIQCLLVFQVLPLFFLEMIFYRVSIHRVAYPC